MKRLLLCLLPFWLCLAAPLALAQEGRLWRLLILDSQKGNPYDEVRTALFRALQNFGYVEGRNLRTTLIVAGNDVATGERLLRDEVVKGYDVILVGGTVATIAAKNVLLGDMKHKVVFAAPTDPVGIGVIRDFASRPFANFTGVSYPVPVKARLRFIRQLMPKAKTFGLIYADMPQSHSYNRWLQELLATDPEFRELKILFRPVPLITGEYGDTRMAELARPIVKALDGQVDAFIKPNDQMGTRRPFAEMVHRTASKPLIGITRDDVMAGWGATAAIFPSHESIGEQAAAMIKQLFEGKQVADIRPEWPRRYGVALDLSKARQFGLSVPAEVLQLAGDNIIE